jgi:hypothetical protein
MGKWCYLFDSCHTTLGMYGIVLRDTLSYSKRLVANGNIVSQKLSVSTSTRSPSWLRNWTYVTFPSHPLPLPPPHPFSQTLPHLPHLSHPTNIFQVSFVPTLMWFTDGSMDALVWHQGVAPLGESVEKGVARVVQRIKGSNEVGLESGSDSDW